ncbi:MAG: MFS transporter [Bacteroidales bacterium]|nr:MFS transporter [Bacteroidales bacterium]
MKNQQKNISPWLWVPTLYFAEGIPYFLVNNISVMMFTRMGVPNGQMALFTSLLYLPWAIKPLWSPFVDILKTKRWWIITMQILMTAAFILLTLTIPHPDAATIAAGETSISLFTVMLVLFFITAFASATHDIAADGFYMLALTQHLQAAFVGARSVFYRLSSIFGQGVLLVIAGLLETHTGNIPLAWQLTLLITSILFALLSLWHTFFLPKPQTDKSSLEGKQQSAVAILREFGRTFVTYFRKPGIWLAMIFMLVYRLPEAFLIKMINPFLVADMEKGGLGLATETVGVVYGTIGVAFLMLGGILGGIYASRVGLRKSLWWMAACMTLPCLSFVYLSMVQPVNLVWISIAIAIEQFGYGFGFTAYMLYMMYFSEGEFKTAHYAICTAFMALSMMIPGAVAGYIQEAIGYQSFFWMVIACCAATLIVTFFVDRQVDPDYGKK